jgi:hypothetical protein
MRLKIGQKLTDTGFFHVFFPPFALPLPIPFPLSKAKKRCVAVSYALPRARAPGILANPFSREGKGPRPLASSSKMRKKSAAAEVDGTGSSAYNEKN